MKLAVLSDSHDNIWKLDEALPHLAGADAVLHCGDLCSPFVVVRLGRALPDRPIHIIWGNNDGDRYSIAKAAQEFTGFTFHGPLADFQLGERRIAANHYPQIATGLAYSGRYDLVCYGHDHTAHQELVGGCLLLNPGEVMGLNGKSTIAIVDLEALEARRVTL